MTSGSTLSSQLDAFRNCTDSLPVAVYTTDAAGFITSYNRAAQVLAGRVPRIGHDRWCVTWRLYWPDGRPMRHDECPMALALKENRIIRGAEAIAERPDGTRFRFTPYPTPVRDQDGAVASGLNVLVDLSGRESAERSLRQALAADGERKIAGMLRLVDAILREAQEKARGTQAHAILTHVIRRVATLAATYGICSDAGGDGGISSWDLLSATCVTASMDLGDGVDLVCESAADSIASETAAPVALIARELIANAARHGRNGRAKVSIRVGLRRDAGGYVLTVEDDGPGFVLAPGQPRSFGLALVLALARQLNGSLEVTRTPGACCSVRFPDPRMLH